MISRDELRLNLIVVWLYRSTQKNIIVRIITYLEINLSMDNVVNDRRVDTTIVVTETFHKKERGEPSYLYRHRAIPRGKRKKYPVKPKGEKKRVKNVSKM